MRKYSIDEFPQFFNVLAGTMSFIGPRAYYPYEIAEQLEIVRPHSGQHHAAGRLQFAQLERRACQHTQEGAVHVLTMLEIEHKAAFALPSHLGKKIPQACAVLKASAPLDAHQHRICRRIDEKSGFGGRIGHGYYKGPKADRSFESIINRIQLRATI